MMKLARFKAALSRGRYKSIFLRLWLGRSLPVEMRSWLQAPDSYNDWKRLNRLTRSAERELRMALAERGDLPPISVLMPVYRPALEFLEQAIGSVMAQIYENWQLVIVDDGSGDDRLHEMISSFAGADSRIVYRRDDANAGISNATNEAFALATGDVVLFMDQDDLISRDCLAEVALHFAIHPASDLVYSDHDKVDAAGERVSPQFKPDWSPTLLLSYMYFGHVVAVRHSLFERVGGLRAAFDGSQDYDFVLRASELARDVGHIPKILYHWRMAAGSTALGGAVKPHGFAAGANAIVAAAERRDLRVRIYRPDWAVEKELGLFVQTFVEEGRSVDFIVPVRDAKQALMTVGRLADTLNGADTLTLVAEQSAELQNVVARIDKKPLRCTVRLVGHQVHCAVSDLCNAAAASSTADALLFVTRPFSPKRSDWMAQLLGQLRLGGVAAVGPRQVNSGRVISAGLLSPAGQLLPAFSGVAVDRPGYLYLARVPHECQGLPSNALLTDRKSFSEAGGFPVGVDDDLVMGWAYCRNLQTGRSVVCADVDVQLSGSAEREVIVDGTAIDRYYNPNLTRQPPLFGVRPQCPPLCGGGPLRVLFVTHSLEREGAPIVLFDLICGLVATGAIKAQVVSLRDGPLAKQYHEQRIALEIIDLPRLRDGTEALALGLGRFGAAIRHFGADLVFANTLEATVAINAATKLSVATLLWHHEAHSWIGWLKRYPAAARAHAYAALSQAYRLVFVADATRQKWQAVTMRDNACVVPHSIPPARLAAMHKRWTRVQARETLGLGEQEPCVLMLGSICDRKGQVDLIRAAAMLSSDEGAAARFYIVGAFVQKRYQPCFQKALDRLKPEVRARIVVADATDDVALYYRAADIFVCCSRAESAPRVLLEAMSFGLPIITTPVDGIPQMVGASAQFYRPGRVGELAASLDQLLASTVARRALADRSLAQVASQTKYDGMVAAFVQLIREAARTSDADWLTLPARVD